jgi:hypothetical protein
MLVAGGALAVPRLQTYIVGSQYESSGMNDGSWMTNNSSFNLKVAGYWGESSNPRPYYDWMSVGLIIGVPRNEVGSVRINGMEIRSFFNLPMGFGGTGLFGDPEMRYAQINLRGLGSMDNNHVGAWHYDHGQIHTPGWGDEFLVDVAVEGFSWSHFGALGISRFGQVFMTPHDHHAGYRHGGHGNSHAVPEPGTLSLLGFGLLGLAPFLKRKKQTP